jgi:hypothetical protein
MAAGPIVDDYSVSLGLINEMAGWERKNDGTPALGAIPTFKWVAGWLIEDLRRIPLDDQAPLGEARVSLTAYDAFTLEPLRVLDERLVRMGQGVTLDAGLVTLVER